MRLTVQKVRYYLKNNQAKWAGSNPNDAKCKQIVTEVFSNLRKVIKSAQNKFNSWETITGHVTDQLTKEKQDMWKL